MAELPTPEETGDRIIDIIKGMNVRAGEIAPIMGIRQHLGPYYRTDDLQAAFDHLEQAGKIEPARDGFVKLTQAGYGPEPSSDEIKRAVLDVLGDYSIRAGDALPMQPIAIALMKQGYSGSEIGDAIEGLATDKLVEMRNGTAFLTDDGFAAI